jgi:uncharacterized protein YjbI with pentapeptide repeats
MDKKSFLEKVFEDSFLCKEDCFDNDFINCQFRNIDFTEYNLSGSSFVDCEFKGCNFSNTVVDNCSFQGVKFQECKFIGILFSRVNTFLQEWEFNKCKLELCMFENMDIRESQFLYSKLFEVTFLNSNLKESEFKGSDLKDTVFEKCNLEKSDFREAKRYWFNISNNRVKGAKFSQPEVLSLLEGFEIEIE